MPLTLFRRHRTECEAHHQEDSKSGQFEEGRRGWKRCACIIHASGTIGGKFSRRQTGAWQWDEAKAIAAKWEATESWDNSGDAPPKPSLAPAEPNRTSVIDATEAFLSHRQNRGVAPATMKKYRTFTRQLRAYGDSRGYVFLDQFTVSDMDRFTASWKDGDRAKAKKLERLKGFIRFCIKRKFITEDIASDLTAPEGASIPLPKSPFSDAELERIFAACDAIGGPTKPGPGHRNWTGEDVKDFILLSIYTGLRISDVATFDITKRLMATMCSYGCTRRGAN